MRTNTFALLAINTGPLPMRVRRYSRNVHGKVWSTAELEIHSVFDGLNKQLESFRTNPETWEIWEDEAA